MTSPLPAFDWDIFCCIVDNFGDIGVTWRLARQLQQAATRSPNRQGGPVRLWVDDLTSFARICPELDTSQEGQWVAGIYIQHWHDTLPIDMTPARVVIEAFACELPEPFIARMASQPTPPCWVNLEYLSAESWVEDCHALASPQRVGNVSLNKFFFFPGFTPKTGGLLCEPGLIASREQWQQDKRGLRAYWACLGLPPKQDNELRISLFTYESAALVSLVSSWCQSATPITLLLPLGRSLPDVLRGAGLAQAITTASAGDLLHSGNLTIKLLPMTDQDGYDRLLWSCDLNLVRGEDSFVRAQWAARPFLWHIYPQEEGAHLVKLEHFLDHYLADLPADCRQWLRQFNLTLNHGPDDNHASGHIPEQSDLPTGEQNSGQLWAQWSRYRAIWQQHGQNWSQKLLKDGDLVTRLVKFLESRI
ncbi:MAG: elongation factor P maturation arginine rhamnosyltransferase EarP [Aeromonas sp.]